MESHFHLRRCEEISKDKHLYCDPSVEKKKFVLSIWAEKNFLVKILNEILVKVNFATYCLKHALEHSNKVKN